MIQPSAKEESEKHTTILYRQAAVFIIINRIK